MALVFRNGKWVEAGDEGPARQDASLPEEEGEETVAKPEGDEDIGILGHIGGIGATALNSATLGVVPALAGLVSPDTKANMQGYLKHYEQSNPNKAMAADIVGGFLTPIPGLGLVGGAGKAVAGAGAKAIAKKIGAAALHGAITSGATSGIKYAGDVKPGEYNWKDQLASAGLGAGVGAVTGGAMSGLGSALSSRAHAARFSAGGGTAGSIKSMGKSFPGADIERASAHADDIAEWALKNKVIGNAGQSFKGSVARADDLFEQAEKKIERIMSKHEATPVTDAKTFRTRIIDELTKSHTHGDIIDPAIKSNIEQTVGGLIDGTLGLTRKGYTKNVLTPRDIQRVKSVFGNHAYNMLGEGPLSDKVGAQIMGKAKAIASDLEDGFVASLSKSDGKALENAKQQYSNAILWKGMGIKGKISEEGLLEHLMGRGARGIPDTYAIGQITNSKNPLLNQFLANSIGGGRIPNAIIAANRGARKVAKQTGMFNPLNPRRLAPTMSRYIPDAYTAGQQED